MSVIISRRNFLVQSSAIIASSLIVPRFGLATLALDKKLILHNIHTGELFKQNIIENGVIVQDTMLELKKFLRDHRSNETHDIDPNLIMLLQRLQSECSGVGEKVFDVVSGYRSPKTNAMLRRRSKGVARNSYHMKGCAVDIKCSNHLREIRNLAKSYQQGGVGYYPRSKFVHVDIRDKPAYWGAA